MKSESEPSQSSKGSWMKAMFSLHGKEKSIPDDRQSEITLIQSGSTAQANISLAQVRAEFRFKATEGGSSKEFQCR
ncbi:unnamed protein product [Penicillium manginii]